MRGDAGTQRALRAAVGRLVGLQLYESLSLAQVLPGVRTGSLPFLPAQLSLAGEGSSEAMKAALWTGP